MKIIKRGHEARLALKRGIDLVADSIKVTLGPAGRNAVLGRMNIPPRITNDGATIARNIEAEDECEQLGVMMLQEATALTDNASGDGTTTTTILLQKIVEDGFERIKDDGSLVSKKVDLMALKKEVDDACAQVVGQLKELARPITDDEIYNVAMTAGEHEMIATTVTEIFKKIGKDGYVKLQEGLKNEYEIYKGIELGCGYQSEYFINDDKRQCVLDNPYIFVTNQALDEGIINPLVTLLGEKEMTRLVIIAPDFTRDLMSRFVTTKVKGNIDVVALKLPYYGKDDLFVDVATVTGATFIDKAAFTKYENMVLEMKFSNLGRVDQAIIGDAKTMLIGGTGDTTARVAELIDLKDKTESVFDKDKLEQRIAFLSGGIAIMTVAGKSDTERDYLKLKAEDTINAVQYALSDGVVPGGGLILLNIAMNSPQTILTNALMEPFKQIKETTGGDVPDNVIDPVKTAIASLQSACSLAGLILTTEVITAFKNESTNKDAH